MKKTLLTASVILSFASSTAWPANTPFKVKITEEQHKISGQQLTDLLKIDSEKNTTDHERETVPTAEAIPNPLNDPFMPQIPKPKAQAEETPQNILGSGAAPVPAVTPPKQPPVIQKPNLTISGIIWNSDRPQAIVNNQVVDVGTTVDNTTVLAINKTGIDVLYSGEKFNIPYN